MASNGGSRSLPDIPKSWFILAALIVAGAALLLHAITEANFLVVLGIVFGIHTIGSESRANQTQQTAQETKQIAATGTAQATVAAIQATTAADAAMNPDNEPPILRGGV